MFELFLDENNRVIGTQNTAIAYHGGATVDEVPENEFDYRYVNGEFVYDPLPAPEPPFPEPSTDEILDVLLGVNSDE